MSIALVGTPASPGCSLLRTKPSPVRTLASALASYSAVLVSPVAAATMSTARSHPATASGVEVPPPLPNPLRPPPRSCDTFVALPDSTPDGAVVFSKNSDREQEVRRRSRTCMQVDCPALSQPAAAQPAPPNNATPCCVHPRQAVQEVQEVVAFAGGEHPAGGTVRCTYISIPQAPRTHAVVLSKPTWMWGAGQLTWVPGLHCARACGWRDCLGRRRRPKGSGADGLRASSPLHRLPPEMGANERGVVVGNEAVWTVEDSGPPALLGMDLVRQRGGRHGRAGRTACPADRRAHARRARPLEQPECAPAAAPCRRCAWPWSAATPRRPRSTSSPRC